MTTFSVVLSSVDMVKSFVDAASLIPCDIDVKSGRYVINAKSIMGLFSLDLSEPLLIEVHGSAEDGEAFRSAVAAYIHN